MPFFARLFLGCALAGATTSCSSLHGIAVGPVAASSQGRSSYGDELRVRAGLGESDGVAMTTFDAGASLRVTEHSQSVSGDLGPTFARWFGPMTLGLSFGTGFGFERYADKLFVDPALHGALVGGLVLDQTTRARRPPAFVPDVVDPRMGAPELGLLGESYCTVQRKRTVLTFELRGGLEPRFTRSPLWTAGLLVGLTFANELFWSGGPAPRRRTNVCE